MNVMAMIIFLTRCYCHSSWNKYFPDDSEREIKKNKFYSNSGNIYVLDCVFTGSGKAINCTGSISKILIESNMFYSVFDDFRAGCVYIKCDCKCILTKNCASKCFSQNGAGFAFFFSSDLGKCTILETSLCNCGSQSGIASGIVICLIDGEQQLENINGSHNHAENFIFELRSGLKSNEAKFCTFSSNTAHITCIFLITAEYGLNKGIYQIVDSNFIRNIDNDPSKKGSLITSFLKLNINHTVFYMNECCSLLVSDGNGQILVTSSFLSSSDITLINGFVEITSCLIDSSSIQINHYGSYYCETYNTVMNYNGLDSIDILANFPENQLSSALLSVINIVFIIHF